MATPHPPLIGRLSILVEIVELPELWIDLTYPILLAWTLSIPSVGICKWGLTSITTPGDWEKHCVFLIAKDLF